ncbi:MAG: Ig-like domain-containing protein, partial [Verrucomicrobiota bacterium]
VHRTFTISNEGNRSASLRQLEGHQGPAPISTNWPNGELQWEILNLLPESLDPGQNTQVSIRWHARSDTSVSDARKNFELWERDVDGDPFQKLFECQFGVQSIKRPPIPILAVEHNSPGEPVRISAAFDESVAGLSQEDFELANGSVVGLLGNGAVYTITATPTQDARSLTIRLPSGRVQGAAEGDLNLESNVLRIPIFWPPPEFEEFMSSYGAQGEDAFLSADPDQDGEDNFFEWVQGSIPTDGNSGPMVLGRILPHAEVQYFSVFYLRLVGGEETSGKYRAGRVLYEIKAAHDIQNWEYIPVHVPVTDESMLPPRPTGYEWGQARLPYDVGMDPSRGFMKVEVKLHEE